MQISIHDTDLVKTDRTSFIESLEQKLLMAPLSGLTRKIFSLQVPYDLRNRTLPKEEWYVDKSLLYHILDNGITWNQGDVAMRGNDVTVSQAYFLDRDINHSEVRNALDEIGQFTKGFHFRPIFSEEWGFWFCVGSATD